MLKMFNYYLPDIHLLEEKTNQFLLWIPDKVYVVLGASNNSCDSLNEENIRKDRVTILKRPSGGQSVVLTPNNIIISAVYFNSENLHPKDIFQRINKLIISAIEKTGIRNMSLVGISDIAIAGKKILGSSIYRNKDALLYHAVLNISEPASTFERYLKHPVKEPDYREGRPHLDFVTSLKEKGYTKSAYHLENLLSISFEKSLFA